MTLLTYPKKRIEIIVEAPALALVLRTLDDAGVLGYTVVPALEGRGLGGHWTRDDSFNNASHMVSVVCIAEEALAEKAVAGVFAVVSAQIGIVSVSDVSVMRKEHF
jgi:nitrogen regulatory protein PII